MAQDLIKKAGWSGCTPHSVSVLASFGSKKFTHYRNQIRSKVCLYNLYDINFYNTNDSFSMHQYLCSIDNIWWYCTYMYIYIHSFIWIIHVYVHLYTCMNQDGDQRMCVCGRAFSLLTLPFSLDLQMTK